MSDQQALDTFGFDIRWRYALDVSDEDAFLFQLITRCFSWYSAIEFFNLRPLRHYVKHNEIYEIQDG